ncbi:MAG: response regulator [Deltaproteobacteria bacterium]|nr:response regulator [Deltaproteobacteria bacterium]
MRPIRVLLIEDNPGDVRLLQAWLADVRGVPLALEHADRLAAGLARLARGGIDAVLLDLSLPDSEGLETFTRAHAHAPVVPIVVLTGLDDEMVGMKAVREGAQDYLVKGQLTGPLLVRALRYAIERQAADADLQRQRDALARSEKLAAMGRLLAGVAHELNNPLTVIVGHTAFLRQTAGGGALGERAEQIARAAERALAQQRPPNREWIVLNPVVQDAVALLLPQLRSDQVEVRVECAPEAPRLWADPHQLQQVVLNLATNAHQALRDAPPPRQLTVRTRYAPEQARVCLEVADTGPGIAPELQRQIFEPLFTTKPPGRGTGLGLAICQGIVEGHGGTIRVESQPGQGAVFVVELPVEARQRAGAETWAAEARAGEAGPPLDEWRGTAFRFDATNPSRPLTAQDVRDLRAKGLGYGEISILLALTANQPNPATAKPLNEILARRRAGKGWGELARELGYKNLGSALRERGERQEKSGRR